MMNVTVFNKKKESLLQLLNELQLDSSQKFSDLPDFKNIPRNSLINDSNIQKFSDMEHTIFSYFDRRSCGWYQRKTMKAYIIAFLRHACKDLGYQLKSHQKNITEKLNGRTFRCASTYYYIIPIIN